MKRRSGLAILALAVAAATPALGEVAAAAAKAEQLVRHAGRVETQGGAFVGLEWMLGLTSQTVAALILPYVIGSCGEPENNLTIGCAWP